MKEETKNRFKKLGKVTAYGLGLFAMLLLGVGLGNCSAKGESVKANAETALHLADQRTLMPKRALDPALWPVLNDDEQNLLLNAEAGHFTLNDDSSQEGYTLSLTDYRDLFLLPLEQGKYSLEFEHGSYSYYGFGFLINEYGAIQIRKAINGEPLTRVLLEYSDVKSGSRIGFDDFDFNRIVSVDDSFNYLCFFVNNGGSPRCRVSLVDPLTIPAVASFDFPVLFNPYPLGGSPASGDFIFNGPSSSGVDTLTLFIRGLSFRSNGKLYNEILLTYRHDPNQTFGHYDAGGDFVLDGTLGSNAWFFRDMLYLYGSEYADVVWNAKFENVDSNLAWKPALVSGGLWVSQDYRHIEVLSFEGSSLVDLPSTSLVADSSVESVLKLLSTYVAPSTSEMGNPFTLIREGFASVGGILQIQILPFMTLGTLIFVPLVVLVILAILKLLAK